MPTIITENDVSQWADETGKRYHFPKRYARHLTPGTRVIYYKGRLKDLRFRNSRLSDSPHYFASAIIGNVSADPDSYKGDLFAEIRELKEFKTAVLAKKTDGNYIEEIPVSQKTNYWRDGVRAASEEVFAEIIRRCESNAADGAPFIPLPQKLSAESIKTAIAQFNSGKVHPFADSTGYDLVYEGKCYPPKAIVGIAAEIETGRKYDPYDFKGGLGSKCFSILEQAGFPVVPKNQEMENENEEEEKSPLVFYEGDQKVKTVKQYERSPHARKECIKQKGAVCVVCAFDFGEKFGSLGIGFIHVHHLDQIADSNGKRVVDPEKDLVPVCPNCHAMLHRKRPAYTPEELKLIRVREN